MCGICGFFGSGSQISGEVLERMNNTLVRRGPDDSGIYRQADAGLAMRRLSIIDVSGGHQPIHNEDSTVWVVFNGEIYNYRELRARLQQKGHRFATNADTEVIVHLYEEYGDSFVQRLRGMFAFALWDARRGRGLIVRDRLGIKPLFYANVRGTLVFGSEIKAILASGAIDRDLNFQALDAFFTFTYIPAPLTIYREIRKLEPGHLLIWEAGSIEKRCYWDWDASSVNGDVSEQQWLKRFDAAIQDAVRSHLVSDVPLGAFLSGGIDSSLVVALMSRDLCCPVETFTMGMSGSHNMLIDERPLAAKVATRYGCDFHEYTVQPDFRGIVGEIVDAFDEPFADNSVIPSYYVCKFARQQVKVALSGLGGDELFAGYERYSGVVMSKYYAMLVPEPLHRRIILPLVELLPEADRGGHRINRVKRFCAAALRSPAERYLSFVSTLSAPERARLFAKDAAAQIDFHATDRLITEPYENCNAPDEVSRALYVDMKTYLPEDILALSDRIGMWHSLEVRVPLVDHQLAELSARLPSRFKLDWRRKKILLRRIAAPYLPREILGQGKQGFESPMSGWLRKELMHYAQDILGPEHLGKSRLFSHEYVSEKLSEHLAGRHQNHKLLFSLIMFQEWYERHMI